MHLLKNIIAPPKNHPCRPTILLQCWFYRLAFTLPLLSSLSLFSAPSPIAQGYPAEFRQKLRARDIIDKYQLAHYETESNITATPYPPAARRTRERPGTIRVLHSVWEPSVAESRRQLPESFVPLRGYRVPLLAHSEQTWPALPVSDTTNSLALAATRSVRERLGEDSLLPELAVLAQILQWPARNPEAAVALKELRQVGFPADLLSYFSFTNKEGALVSGEMLLPWVIAQLSRGRGLSELTSDLKSASFHFTQSAPGLRLAREDGSAEIKLFRLQCGGGYQNGILPGSNLELINRFCEALPEAAMILSVDEDHLEPCRWLAAHVWPLRRLRQLTIVAEPLPVSAWAQDNDKAGYIYQPDSRGKPARASITPRFASKEDAEPLCVPGESFLMEGLRPAGLEVLQSPLLYEGGDLMAVQDPRSRRNLLLIGESELNRNIALGLSREQVLEAFRVEMGMDDALVWPEGSFHLDYDVTFRQHGNLALAFVNDPLPAARMIVANGLSALETNRFIDGVSGAFARDALGKGDYSALSLRLEKVLSAQRRSDGKYLSPLPACFRIEALDSPTANFQCFLTAVDFLLASDSGLNLATLPKEKAELIEAFRSMTRALAAQRALLQARGWRVVQFLASPIYTAA